MGRTNSRIKPISDKRAKQLADYKVVRKVYMSEHPTCEAECNNPATEIHHKRGRMGKQLIVIGDFMAVCRECHTYIEEHPAWAKAKGYSVSRLSNG